MIEVIRSFTRGEISPALWARCDLPLYQAALSTMRNTFVMKQGGAQNRPGTAYVDQAMVIGGGGERLIPFKLSSTQSYVLEFGNSYIRFIKNGSLIQSGGTAYKISSPYSNAELAALDFAQQGNQMTIVHPGHVPRKLVYTSDTSWALTTMTFASSVTAPTGLSGSISSGVKVYWGVTAVDPDTGEESLLSATIGATQDGNTTTAQSLYWTGTPTNPNGNLYKYNIYKAYDQFNFGFIGTGAIDSGTGYFNDPQSASTYGGASSTTGIPPDYTHQPPTTKNPFSGTNLYPGAVSYIQQRLTFGCSNTYPARIWTSQTGRYNNFATSIPPNSADALTFDLVSDTVERIAHFTQLGTTIVMTSEGEWALWGDGSQAAVLSPSTIGAKKYGYNGSNLGKLKPIVINTDALFVQALGSHVRDLNYQFQQYGYVGDDLSNMSAHLVDGYTIVDWSYAQLPNSIVWIVRQDGSLLGLTYDKAQQIVAWHRHDTLVGLDVDNILTGFNNVCCIPEGNETAVYFLVTRNLPGGAGTNTFIERMATRLITNAEDVITTPLCDCSLTFDGRSSALFGAPVTTINPYSNGWGAIPTMTLSSGGGWTYTDKLTLTSSDSFFTSGMVGSEIHLLYNKGNPSFVLPASSVLDDGIEIIRCKIASVTSPTVAMIFPDKTVPSEMQGFAIISWAWAVSQVTSTGASNVYGTQPMTVQGDGFVVGSPNNPAYPKYVWSSDTLTLDRCYAVIIVGLPYISDIETLNINTQKGEPLSDKKIAVGEVIFELWNTRGLFVGSEAPDPTIADQTLNLNELKQRNHETMDFPISLESNIERVIIDAKWSKGGRVFVRQVDPLPFSILSINPRGFIPSRGDV